MDATRTARATARAELTRAILDSAAAQLAEVGPAALSVRAVARDLGMASSAVYRYFESRDALLTALVVESHDELGDAVETAAAGVRARDLRGRWRAACHALRDWALANPHRFALAYGSPVPGYVAPEDAVVAASRVTGAFFLLLGDAQQAGRKPVGPTRVSASEKTAVAPVMRSVEPPLTAAYAVRGLGAWATLIGQVSLELFGHQEGSVLDSDTHWVAVIDQLAVDLGLA